MTPDAPTLLATLRQQLGVIDEATCSIVTRDDGCEPDLPAFCPSCAETTHWRGPHPRVVATPSGRASTPDPPLYTRTELGAEYVYVRPMLPNEERVFAADRLYRLADQWRDRPRPLEALPGAVRWQAALCDDCEVRHQRRWLDAVWPERRRPDARGGDLG
jgi:hypothetical protein